MIGTVRELVAVARSLMADVSLLSLEETLDDLDTLSSNLDRAFADFGQHFRLASFDPEIVSQFDLLSKARAGLENALIVQSSVKKVIESNPEDKTAVRVSRVADVMVARFKKHVQDAQKVVSTISRKTMPESLKRYALDVKNRIRAKLVDPNVLEVIPWQRESYNRESRMTGVEYQVVFRIQTGNSDVGDLEGFASEFSTGSTGVTFSPRKWGKIEQERMDSKEAAVKFLENVRGWDGIKGEAEAIDKRAEVAQKIKAALDNLMRGGWMGQPQSDGAQIYLGNIKVRASYRSDLPKEGSRAVGEDEYERMLDAEIAAWRKRLDPVLRPFAADIREIGVYGGEKSWIYTDVVLQ